MVMVVRRWMASWSDRFATVISCALCWSRLRAADPASSQGAHGGRDVPASGEGDGAATVKLDGDGVGEGRMDEGAMRRAAAQAELRARGVVARSSLLLRKRVRVRVWTNSQPPTVFCLISPTSPSCALLPERD